MTNLDPALEAQLRAQYGGGPLNVDPKTAAMLQGQQFRTQPASIMPQGGLASVAPPVGPAQALGGTTPAEIAQAARTVDAQDRQGMVDYAASGGSPPPPRLPPPPAPRIIPGGFRPHTRSKTVEEGVQFSPETQKDVAKAEEAGEGVVKATGELADAQAEQERHKAMVEANDLQAEAAAERVRKNKQNSAMEWHWDKLMGMQRDLAQAQAKGVDPQHYMKNKSTFGNIAQMIALIGGGLSAGITGGRNQALDFINNEIDRDVNAQRETIAGKERAFGQQQGLYGLLRQKGMDDDTAATGARLLHREQVQKQLEAELNSARDAKAKLVLQQTIKDNAMEMAKLRGTFDEKASAKVQTSGSEVYAPPQVVGQPGGIPEKEMGLLFRDPSSGQTYKAGSEESRKKMTGALDLNGEVSTLADKYAAAVDQLSTVDKLSMSPLNPVGPTAKAAEARTLYFQLQGKFRQASDDGVWKKSESEMLSQQLAPPDKIVNGQGSNQAAMLKRGAQTNTARVMQIERPEAVQTGYGRNAQGQVVPRAAYQGETYQAPRDQKTPKGFKEQ